MTTEATNPNHTPEAIAANRERILRGDLTPADLEMFGIGYYPEPGDRFLDQCYEEAVLMGSIHDPEELARMEGEDEARLKRIRDEDKANFQAAIAKLTLENKPNFLACEGHYDATGKYQRGSILSFTGYLLFADGALGQLPKSLFCRPADDWNASFTGDLKDQADWALCEMLSKLGYTYGKTEKGRPDHLKIRMANVDELDICWFNGECDSSKHFNEWMEGLTGEKPSFLTQEETLARLEARPVPELAKAA